MAHNTGMMGRQRNFGMQGGPGKGDNDRTSDREAYNKNLSKIKFDGNMDGFIRRGNRLVKIFK